MLVHVKNFRRILSKFNRDRAGAPALEFAILAPVFFGFVLAIMETGWLFIRISLMESAVSQAGRFVYTGAAQYGVVDQNDIESFICSKITVMSKTYCEGNIALELVVIDDFDSAPDDEPTCASVDMEVQPVTDYDPGQASEIVYMRVCILTDLFMPGLGFGAGLSKTDSDKYRMTSAFAFMNEPF